MAVSDPIGAQSVSRPSVVFIHGQPGSGADWARLQEELGSAFETFAPDRPGWARNQAAAAGVAANADWLAAAIGDSALPVPAVLVGHSWGGGVALEVAMRHPEVVGALVLIGSVGVANALSTFDRVLAVDAVGHQVIRAGTASVRRGRRAAKRFSNRPLVGRSLDWLSRSPTIRALAWVDEQPLTARERESFLVEQKALLAETRLLEARLGLVNLPTAVLHGSLDRIVSREATTRLAGLIPGAEWIELPGEGHLVPIERPEAVAPVIARYAALLSAPAPGDASSLRHAQPAPGDGAGSRG
jgi:3-oxoadipate enol-lactonase